MKTRPKAYGTQQRRFQEGVCSDSIIPQEAREASNRQPNSVSREAKERRTKKPKISRRKEIIKIRAEINGKEMKETVVKNNKTKSWFLRIKTKLTNLWPGS